MFKQKNIASATGLEQNNPSLMLINPARDLTRIQELPTNLVQISREDMLAASEDNKARFMYDRNRVSERAILEMELAQHFVRYIDRFLETNHTTENSIILNMASELMLEYILLQNAEINMAQAKKLTLVVIAIVDILKQLDLNVPSSLQILRDIKDVRTYMNFVSYYADYILTCAEGDDLSAIASLITKKVKLISSLKDIDGLNIRARVLASLKSAQSLAPRLPDPKLIIFPGHKKIETLSESGKVAKILIEDSPMPKSRIDKFSQRWETEGAANFHSFNLPKAEITKTLNEIISSVTDETVLKKLNREAGIVSTLEKIGVDGVTVEFLTPGSLVERDTLAELGKMRHSWLKDKNWKGETPELFQAALDVDYRDLLSGHIIIRLGDEILACSRLAYPEPLSRYSDVDSWADSQALFGTGPIRYGFDQQENGGEMLDSLDSYQASPVWEEMIPDLNQGLVGEAERFVVNKELIEKLGENLDRREKIMLALLSVKLLCASTCAFVMHNNGTYLFDQADSDFTSTLISVLGENTTGGGLTRITSIWTDDKLDYETKTSTRSHTNYNLLNVEKGLEFASNGNDMLAATISKNMLASLQQSGFTVLRTEPAIQEA